MSRDTTGQAASFQHLWLDQLAREFKDICYQYDLALSLPVFELSSATRQQGCWQPTTRVLKISQPLIRSRPWEIVLMVLKHEMAHQICTELWDAPASGHGPAFQRACQLLGVIPPYNQAVGDLEQVAPLQASESAQSAAARKTIKRIHKLLALAGSDNEHEAALAMQRATRIMAQHNLDMATLETSQPSIYTRIIIKTGARQIPTYRRLICAILRDYFFVQVICASLYDARQLTSYKTIELFGKSENVPVAEHCYHFLEQQLASLWQKNKHRFQGNKRTAKNSYYLGLLRGFSEKMAEQSLPTGATGSSDPTAHQSTSALVVAEDRGLQLFIKHHFPCLVNRKIRSSRIYKAPYDTAVTTGKKIILQHCIKESKEGVQGLLKK